VANFPPWLAPDQVRVITRKRLQNAQQTRHDAVIGGRDMEAGQVSMRLHHGGPQSAKPKAEVVADILASIKERKA
jgi:threonyl-tRNA synthetase